MSTMNRRTVLTTMGRVPLLVSAAALGATEAGAGDAPPLVLAPEPATWEALESYNAWLFYERRRLLESVYPPEVAKGDFVPLANAGARWQFARMFDRADDCPTHRAAFVLSAVGCDWREPA